MYFSCDPECHRKKNCPLSKGVEGRKGVEETEMGEETTETDEVMAHGATEKSINKVNAGRKGDRTATPPRRQKSGRKKERVTEEQAEKEDEYADRGITQVDDEDDGEAEVEGESEKMEEKGAEKWLKGKVGCIVRCTRCIVDASRGVKIVHGGQSKKYEYVVVDSYVWRSVKQTEGAVLEHGTDNVLATK